MIKLTAIALLLGLFAGIAFGLWLFLGNRWTGEPTPDALKEDFSGQPNPYLVRLLVGNAEIEQMAEAGRQFVRLRVNEAGEGRLALAQIDDYTNRPHGGYAWRPPLIAEARLRFSSAHKPGSAGFFLWNNPIPLWAEMADVRPIEWIGFIHNSDRATMKFKGDEDPRFRASVVGSNWPQMAGLYGVAGFPAPRVAEAALDRLDVTRWHTYTIEWRDSDDLRLLVDGETVLESSVEIKSRLALVLWVDNNLVSITGRGVNVTNEEMRDVWLDVDYVEIQPLVE